MEDLGIERGTNYITKRQVYQKYAFPQSTPYSIFVKGAHSGVGFQTKYQPEWKKIISEAAFKTQVQLVG